MSAPCSPAARQRSGWSRWSPADHSPKPRSSWESHPDRLLAQAGRAGLLTAQATSTRGQAAARPLGFETASGASPANSAILTCPWSTTSNAAGHCRTGASASGTWDSSSPGCRPSHACICQISGTASASSRPSTSGSSVTSGEPTFAPRPIEATQPPDVQEDWRRSWNGIWWALLTATKPRAAYTSLRAELDNLASTLAMTIDPSPRGDSSLGTVALYVSRHPRRPRRQRAPDGYFEDDYIE